MPAVREILYASSLPRFLGGVERYIFDTATLLKNNGFRVSALFSSLDNADPAYLNVFDEVHDPHSLPHVISKNYAMAFIHKLNSADIVAALRNNFHTTVFVHDHDYYCPRRHKYFPITRKNCHRPFSLFACSCCTCLVEKRHGGIRPLNILARAALLREIRACDSFAVMSGFMRGNLTANTFNPDRIKIVYPPCALPEDECREVMSTPANPPRIVYVGQLIRGKGVDRMLHALALLNTPFQAEIVGDGHDRPRLEHLAHTLGLADRVSFTGWMDDPAAAYANADIAVFPSVWQEPFGMTGIEAFSHRRPVVAFDTGGVSEWLKHQHNGLLVPPDNPRAMADAIASLIANPSTARRFGENGRRMVAERFNTDNFLRAFADLIPDKEGMS